MKQNRHDAFVKKMVHTKVQREDAVFANTKQAGEFQGKAAFQARTVFTF